jgi:hypothetical protein
MSDEEDRVYISEWPVDYGTRDKKRSRIADEDDGTSATQDETLPNLHSFARPTTDNSDGGDHACHFETANVALAKWWRRKLRQKSEDASSGERCSATTEIMRIARCNRDLSK